MGAMPLLFSYGTLQQEEVQLSTFGRKLDGEKDLLLGYEPSLVKIPDAAVAQRLGRTHHDNVTATAGNFNRSVAVDGQAIKEDSLLLGYYYFNIHTSNNPGGEIRGQIEL